MRRLLGMTLVTLVVSGSGTQVRSAEDADAKAVIDKAIESLGGEAKLSKAKGFTWKTKGTFILGGNESSFTGQTTVAGLNQFRGEFEGEFGGNKVKGVTVLAGDKGWRKFGDMSMELDAESLANEKRSVYLQAIPVMLLPLMGTDFKVEMAGDEKVGNAAAAVIKVTGPDGKDFKLYFDKTSGLPTKQVATVRGFMGEEFEQETTYSKYKDFDGIKKATKSESTRDGERFIKMEISDFKLLDDVDSKTFAEPK